MRVRAPRRLMGGLVLLSLIAAGWLVTGQTGNRLEQARRYLALGDVELACAAYRQHLIHKPDDSTAWLEFGEALKPVDADAALEAFRQIPPDAREYLTARRHVAHLSILRGDDDSARAELERLREQLPDDFAVALALTELYFRTKRFRDALPLVQHVVELQPDRASSFVLLAEILDELGRTPEMIGPLRKTLELEPDEFRAHALLAFALRHANRLDEAAQHADWCSRQRSNDAFVWRVQALISRDRGDRSLALEQATRALQLKPDDLWCRLLKADILLFDRRAEEAWQTLAPLQESQSESRDYLGALARAAAMSGRKKEARDCQQKLALLMGEEPPEVIPK